MLWRKLKIINVKFFKKFLNIIKIILVKKSLFSENEIWRCLIHILTGLSVLHDEKICHRDIKSGNIFISQDHKMETIYKLGDFNVSKIAKNNIMKT
jgi:NIMA (never in mitosis gene a)-related kinase